MVQRLKALATKSDDLSLISITTWGRREPMPINEFFDYHECAVKLSNSQYTDQSPVGNKYSRLSQTINPQIITQRLSLSYECSTLAKACSLLALIT